MEKGRHLRRRHGVNSTARPQTPGTRGQISIHNDRKEIEVKHLLFATAVAFSSTVFAADDKPPTPQQQRMADCSKEAKAKGLAGEERKNFMRECLKGSKSAASRGTAG